MPYLLVTTAVTVEWLEHRLTGWGYSCQTWDSWRDCWAADVQCVLSLPQMPRYLPRRAHTKLGDGGSLFCSCLFLVTILTSAQQTRSSLCKDEMPAFSSSCQYVNVIFLSIHSLVIKWQKHPFVSPIHDTNFSFSQKALSGAFSGMNKLHFFQHFCCLKMLLFHLRCEEMC